MIFISYSRTNQIFAIKLAQELKAEGFSAWLDQLDIAPGARWDDEVYRALAECEIFMLIMTPASVSSENVKDEIGYAIDSRKRIVPVLLEKCEIPFRLRRLQYVDFSGKSFDEGVQSVKELLKGLITKHSVPSERTHTDIQDQNSQTEANSLFLPKVEQDRVAPAKANTEHQTKEEVKEQQNAQVKTEVTRSLQEGTNHHALENAEKERIATDKSETEQTVNAENDAWKAQVPEAVQNNRFLSTLNSIALELFSEEERNQKTKKNWLLTWWKRGIIALITVELIGILFGFLMFGSPVIFHWTHIIWIVFGVIFYPHILSYVLFVFLLVSSLFYSAIFATSGTQARAVALYGPLFAIMLSAVISRILRIKKII